MLKDAQLLIKELDEEIQDIIQTDGSEFPKKKNQIEDIDNAIDKLLSCDIPIPSGFKSKKASLEADIAKMDDPDLALPVIRDDLVELTHKIDRYLRDSKKKSVQKKKRKYVKKSRGNTHPFAPGEITPSEILRSVLLEVLHDMDGGGDVGEIHDRMIKRIGNQLTDLDHEKHSNGTPRWWNNTQWIRQKLIYEGILRDDSPRGVWELK
ncbi:MAG: winged helix-turn-helix domain-containing protein [Methanofollis sp.]|nr:winged helix-turn-helix domain-containing protein [Methanofollis sp.]